MPATRARADALAARLAPLAAAGGAGWLGAARAAAAARLAAMGLPGRRDEYWRYTDPATLNAPEPPAAAPGAPEGPPLAGAPAGPRLVFADGVFDAAASDRRAPAGVEIARLSEAAAADIHWARELYGLLEARGQNPVARPFAALNTAHATDGLLVRATGRAAVPLCLIHRHEAPAGEAILHHCIRLEPGAELTLIENGPVAARFNTVLEVEIGAGAAFHHIRLQGRDHGCRATTHVFARLAERATLKSFTLAGGGRLLRNEAVVELAGAEASAHVVCAVIGDGDCHHDDTVFVIHAAERCESRQVFKKVLGTGATGVFQGKILVRPGAQKTDGYQLSRALLLDAESQFLAKPELEIHADDVKCSHGSTAGALDDAALFYLRSRGVPRAEAQALLVQAFLAEAIDEIADAALAEAVRDRLEGWLAQRAGRPCR
jgi:Fe-S cluster assembly protein SufD